MISYSFVYWIYIPQTIILKTVLKINDITIFHCSENKDIKYNMLPIIALTIIGDNSVCRKKEFCDVTCNYIIANNIEWNLYKKK